MAWRETSTFIGASTFRVLSISALSLLRGLAEAAVLVIVARVALAVADGDERLGLDLGPLGVQTMSISEALGLAAVAALLMLVLHIGVAALASRMSTDALSAARTRLSRAFLAASWEIQSKERDGHLQDVLTTYAERVMAAAGTTASIATATFNLIALIGTAIVVDARAALAIFLGVALLAGVLRPLNRLTRRRAAESRDDNTAFATSMTEMVSLAQEVTLFDVGPAVDARLQSSVNKATASQRLVSFLSITGPAVYQTLAVLIVLGALALLRSSESGSVAELGAVVLLLIRSISFGQQLQVGANSLNQYEPYVRAIRDREIEYRDQERTAGDVPVTSIDRLQLTDASYRYGDAVDAVAGIDLEIARGDVIGLVGPSGSGKSTLIQILLRLRLPDSGSYLINGQDAEGFSLSDWYRRLAVVPQTPRLLEATVADNIRFFRDVDDAQIERAARRAHIHDEIVSWSNGYQTVLQGSGSGVSGGQAQRLCIARALADDPQLLVLDEPTSALDVHSEELIQQTLDELHGEVTMVVIAHRLSTLRLCDRILVLEDGRVRGFDTAERLEQDNPYFTRAVELSRRS